MANNYTEATLQPTVYLTERQEALLSCYGAGCEPDGPGDKLRYVFWESYFNDTPDDYDMDEAIADGILEEGAKLPSIEYFLREVLLNPENRDIEHLDVQGCHRCDKLRPGEFGGFSLVVTRNEYAWINSSMIHVADGKISPPNIVINRFDPIVEILPQ